MVQEVKDNTSQLYLEQKNPSCLYPKGDPYKDIPFTQPNDQCFEQTAPIYHQQSCVAEASVQQECNDNIKEGMTNDIPNIARLKKKPAKKTVPFWSKDPNVLLNKNYATELFPVDNMSFTRKLNALTRLVIIMTVFAFLYTKSTRILGIGALSILAIFLLYFAYEQTNKEGLGNLGSAGYMVPDKNMLSVGPRIPMGEHELNPDIPPEQFSKVFDEPTPTNPLSNVLIPDYVEDPHKKPAPPAFTSKGSDAILQNAKEMVVKQNPGQPDIADKLFGDLGDELDFENSLQRFYSTPSSTIPNDQGAFAQFCYGNMVSAKEGNMMALGRNLPRYTEGN